MIVTSVESGWEVVFQRSHGLLAGQLATNFRLDFRPHFWTQTLETILSHDDNKQPFDARHYVTDLGAPRDFTLVSMASPDRVAEAERRIIDNHRKHRWCGLLMSMHVQHLYGAAEGISAEMKALLKAEAARRRRVLRQLNRKAQQLEDAYQLLRWCDRCSLILARNRIPDMGRRIEVTHDLGRQRYDLWRREDDTVCVEPWPFAPDAFDVELELRRATTLAFKNDADLLQHLDGAEIEARTWTFRR
ncbi:hypothetical protein Pla175_29490 [Pirellulimonas nuda]|uniref:DUF3891 domain-containing protein n=1 Tax=Pirellulimonas nuda TaxID=2528009 RepID=A0A518DDL0_9BACT|nr:DUF3891 family protein [Pirellulimonas nuda]QDU89557.1 hypothetical protein Pla175_29490 [Pirellulimonas nuda]